MKKGKADVLLIMVMSLVVGIVSVGVGWRMRADGYAAWWVFVLLGVPFAACLGILGYAVIRYIRGDDTVKKENGAEKPAPPSKPVSAEDLQSLRSFGLQISEDDYQKLRQRIAEENQNQDE